MEQILLAPISRSLIVFIYSQALRIGAEMNHKVLLLLSVITRWLRLFQSTRPRSSKYRSSGSLLVKWKDCSKHGNNCKNISSFIVLCLPVSSYFTIFIKILIYW